MVDFLYDWFRYRRRRSYARISIFFCDALGHLDRHYCFFELRNTLFCHTSVRLRRIGLWRKSWYPDSLRETKGLDSCARFGMTGWEGCFVIQSIVYKKRDGYGVSAGVGLGVSTDCWGGGAGVWFGVGVDVDVDVDVGVDVGVGVGASGIGVFSGRGVGDPEEDAGSALCSPGEGSRAGDGSGVGRGTSETYGGTELHVPLIFWKSPSTTRMQ